MASQFRSTGLVVKNGSEDAVLVLPSIPVPESHGAMIPDDPLNGIGLTRSTRVRLVTEPTPSYCVQNRFRKTWLAASIAQQ